MDMHLFLLLAMFVSVAVPAWIWSGMLVVRGSIVRRATTPLMLRIVMALAWLGCTIYFVEAFRLLRHLS